VEELDVSRRRVLEAGDAQRRRLERELREGAEQRLAEVEALLAEAGKVSNGAFAATVAETTAEVERARAELREFARGVHPRVLTEGGLAAALHELANGRTVPVALTAPRSRFAPPVEAAAYFVCAEALTNVDKYAEASHAVVEVVEHERKLVVSVRDDGRGGAAFDAGSGLRGLADRVEALGGRLTLASVPGEGTELVAEIPLG
jgi:signal transduction histidine kinase